MNQHSRPYFDVKALIGLLIIIGGALLLLDNIGFDIDIDVWQYWPLILIVIGIGQLARSPEQRQTGSGLIFFFVGLVILLNNLDVIDFDFSDIWPVFLILIGIGILRQSFWKGAAESRDKDFINLFFIMGGGDHTYSSKSIKGGKVSAIMGGGTIDLRDGDFEGDSIEFHTFTFWGGIQFRIPENWNVNIKATPILGGVDNKTMMPQSGGAKKGTAASVSKTVVIRGTAIMGGIEVKN